MEQLAENIYLVVLPRCTALFNKHTLIEIYEAIISLAENSKTVDKNNCTMYHSKSIDILYVYAKNNEKFVVYLTVKYQGGSSNITYIMTYQTFLDIFYKTFLEKVKK